VYEQSLEGVQGDENPLTPRGHPPSGGGTGDPRAGGGGESEAATQCNENVYALYFTRIH
jgi:hypothetical protein